MLKPHLKNKRRKKGADLNVISITLPSDLLEKMEEVGVTSGRGGGNLSAFVETACEVLLGLLNNPQEADKALVSIVRHDATMQERIDIITENLKQTAHIISAIKY